MGNTAEELHDEHHYESRISQDQIDLAQRRQDFLNNLPKIEDVTQAILNHQNK